MVKSIDIVLKNQLKAEAEVKFFPRDNHAALDNLDYDHSGHTGFASTKYVETNLITKVDKIEGKGLSSEDFTPTEKKKLDEIEKISDEEINDILAR